MKNKQSDINKMRAKLKVAENALKGLLEIVCDDCKSSYNVNGQCVKCPRVKAATAALDIVAHGCAGCNRKV